MNAYLATPLVAAGFFLVLVAAVLTRGHRGTAYRVFACCLLSAAAWSFLIFKMRTSPDLETALFWEKGVLIAIDATVVFFFHFTLIYTNERKKRLIALAYIFLTAIIVLSFSNLLLHGMQLKSYGYAPIPSNFFLFPCLFGIYFFSIFSLRYLIKASKNSFAYKEQQRFLCIIIGLVISLIGGIFDLLPVLGLPLYPGSIIGNLIFCSLTTIAILKYHMFDVRVAIRKSTTFFLVSALIAVPYAGILVGLSAVLGDISLWIYLLLLIVIAAAVQPLWRKTQDWVERRFFRDRYEYIKRLQEFSEEATGISEIERLAKPLLETLSRAMETDKAYLFLLSPTGDFVQHWGNDANDLHYPSTPFLSKNSLFIKFIDQHTRELHRRDFDIFPQLQVLPSRERNLLLQETKGELFIPLKASGELIGILILASKISHQLYGKEDMDLLASTLPQIAVKLDNARLFEQNKRRQKQIESINLFTRIISSGTEMTQALKAFVQEIQTLLPFDQFSIAIKEKGLVKGIFTFPGMPDDSEAGNAFSLQKSALEWLIQNKQTLIENDLHKEQRFPADEAHAKKGVRAIIRSPLIAKGVVFGELHFASIEPNVYNERHKDLLEQMAVQISGTVENIYLLQAERETREKLEQEIEMRTGFLRMLTHELNTPLTPILSSGKLLVEHLPPEQEIEARLAKNILAGAQTLSARLSELMDLFKSEMGLLKITPEVLETENLLQRSVKQYSPVFTGKKQDFQTKITPPLPPVLADEKRVEQILLNLLNNANKFTPEKGKITLSARTEKGFLFIEIENNGPGISPEEQRNLFLPYHHSDRFSGMGLGLVICKQLVELQGGKIWYRGQPGKGNVFSFSLPLAKQP